LIAKPSRVDYPSHDSQENNPEKKITPIDAWPEPVKNTSPAFSIPLLSLSRQY
jgi:hypothetical protein